MLGVSRAMWKLARVSKGSEGHLLLAAACAWAEPRAARPILMAFKRFGHVSVLFWAAFACLSGLRVSESALRGGYIRRTKPIESFRAS